MFHLLVWQDFQGLRLGTDIINELGKLVSQMANVRQIQKLTYAKVQDSQKRINNLN